MEIKAILDALISQLSFGPYILLGLSILGSLVVVAQVIVVLTPTQKDDELVANLEKGFLGKILDAVKSFAPIQKK